MLNSKSHEGLIAYLWILGIATIVNLLLLVWILSSGLLGANEAARSQIESDKELVRAINEFSDAMRKLYGTNTDPNSH